ncbi:uncharacterized protein EI97DRAFT_431362 [Westerdykella ornata]|uniref:Uncharacterized protein n=1 Tax=Westerdykella ornata TaxID=318751 RepID=A0A6A6JNA9_WESOR|nr:uncharacterized protein EI97DRAFT_431362 [Westerdykella ornata]KAF2278101.1 hypothetical protein EI97DRAFT_431362 [Westerdykella ornata]
MISKRDNGREYCYVNADGSLDCYNYGFWYSDTGTIVKYSILGAIFVFFLAWFVGGYLHARSRMRKGKKLLLYHRWLVSYADKRRYGQLPHQQQQHHQNHFTFYSAAGQQPSQPYTQRNDSAWPDAPPVYAGNDAPPSYYAPASPKPPFYPMQNVAPLGNAGVGGQQQQQQQQQESGVVGAGASLGQSQQQQQQGVQGQGQGQNGTTLPTRPEQAKVVISKLVSRLRR